MFTLEAMNMTPAKYVSSDAKFCNVVWHWWPLILEWNICMYVIPCNIACMVMEVKLYAFLISVWSMYGWLASTSNHFIYGEMTSQDRKCVQEVVVERNSSEWSCWHRDLDYVTHMESQLSEVYFSNRKIKFR